MVVSKPREKNTTFLSGLFTAIFIASNGEYTIRTSAPFALASNKEPRRPFTRMASPKVQKITPGFCAISMHTSMRPIGNTHTGQPGPWINSMLFGNKRSNPNLKMVWVCPPQTSMRYNGFSGVYCGSCAIRCSRCSTKLLANFGSRNSSMNCITVSLLFHCLLRL